MDLTAYKGKTLDDETLAALSDDIAKHSEALESRALKAEDKARKAASESIEGRKGKDAVIAKAFEKLGIETAEELDSLPDAKGQAEALKQFEIKLKRSEREREEALKAAHEVTGRWQREKRERAIAEQLGKHPFADLDVARAVISANVAQEGEELLFVSADGLKVPLADGVAALVKSKPVLLKQADNGAGSGSGFKGSATAGGAQRNPFHPKTFNLTEQIALKLANPQLAEQLKAAAAAAT